MIKPTIGRVVWYFPPGADGSLARHDGTQPLYGVVCHVWNDRLINIGGFDSAGTPYKRASVILIQPGDPPTDYGHAEFPPAAAKAQDMEKTLAEKFPPSAN